jgi:hypothetical protein
LKPEERGMTDVHELLRYLRKYFDDHTEQAQRIDAALALIANKDAEIERLKREAVNMNNAYLNVIEKADSEMLLVKACEHIAEGEEGWEKLRNECPSTMAVATLRDKYEANKKTLDYVRERLKGIEERLIARLGLGEQNGPRN